MNPKKIWIGIGVCLVALSVLGATIIWYDDASIPQKTVFDGSEVLSVQQTGPNAYRWSFLSDIRDYTAGSGGDPVTIIYVTTLNVTTNYTTNAFITTLTVVSNAYFSSTNFINYSIVTNLTVENNSIFKGNATFNSNTFITNLFFTIARPEVIAWAGPTNTLNFNLGSLQKYTTATPFSVTNVIGTSNNFASSTLLVITNLANSNVWFYPPTGYKMGTNDMTNCTAGGVFKAWFVEENGTKSIATKLFP